MSTPKAEALRILERMPDDVNWDSLVYRLFVVAKVKEGFADFDAGRVISHEQMKQEIASWRASRGPSVPETTSDASTPTSPPATPGRRTA